MKISFTTFGCKLNQAETDEIKNILEKKDCLIVLAKTNEQIAIVRACAVTCKASQRTREAIRSLKKNGAYIIATGCLENTDLKQIDFIAKDAKSIVKHISQMMARVKQKQATKKLASKTRKFIKIQNGCNFECSYCIIPKFRGKSMSIKAEKIIKKINDAHNEGIKEVVLTGINICQYDDKGVKLSDLLEMIVKKTKILRIRLGSLDPRLIDKKLVKLYNKKNQHTVRLLPHWHLSLQSGSDSVLKRMKRGYTTAKYYGLIKKLRLKNSLFSFTTDIIVGFPQESEKEFAETKKFVKKILFSKVHIFPFSPRPGTHAFYLKPLHNQTVSNRIKQLSATAEQASKKFRKKFNGKKRDVLFENKKNEMWSGYSPEYIQIKLKSSQNLSNAIMKVKM
ncbi:MAG: tRNA (N(6)-L-threonylcarbamoyladenosine(37)-C(2))-methylthiotransferase MtaB [bacterium]